MSLNEVLKRVEQDLSRLGSFNPTKISEQDMYWLREANTLVSSLLSVASEKDKYGRPSVNDTGHMVTNFYKVHFRSTQIVKHFELYPEVTQVVEPWLNFFKVCCSFPYEPLTEQLPLDLCLDQMNSMTVQILENLKKTLNRYTSP